MAAARDEEEEVAMLSKFDDYPIHQTPEPIAVPVSTDRNAYDRYWFNGYTDDGEFYFGIGAALYPNLWFNAIKDFAKYPELRWLNRYHVVPGVVLAVACFLFMGWQGLVWGFFISTVLLYHGTFVINSLCHMFGRVRYKTTDTSRNSLLLALITLGEGWHNNHHHYATSTNMGFFWWEIDVSYYTLKVLSFFGLVWDIKKPPQRVLEARG